MNRVLIIKLGALGDAVVATPAIRQIHAHHHSAEVTLLTSDELAGLFRHWEGLRISSFPRRGWRAFLHLIRWVRAQNFQRLYDLQSNDRTTLICALSGVPERVGNHPRYPYTHHPSGRYRGQCHMHERLLDVLRAAGMDARPEPPFLPVTADETEQVRRWLRARGLTGKPIAILHAGSSAGHREKRWPHFRELAAELLQAGLTAIWIGGPDDIALNRELSRAGGIDATAEFTLNELVELGRNACFAVTNDSAPMHAFACSGIPVFALFGPTDWRRHHAVGQQANIIAADASQPSFAPAPIGDLEIGAVTRRLRLAGLLH